MKYTIRMRTMCLALYVLIWWSLCSSSAQPEVKSAPVSNLYCSVDCFGTPDGKIPSVTNTINVTFYTVTNMEYIYIPFNKEYSCEMSLYDHNGNALTKTDLGKKCGINFNKAKKYYTKANSKENADYDDMRLGKVPRAAFQESRGSPNYKWCKLTDYFNIPSPGHYTLEIRLQIYKYITLGTDSYIKLIKLPAVKFEVKK